MTSLAEFWSRSKGIVPGPRLLRFTIVGIAGTVIYYVTLYLLVERFYVPVLWASSAAFVLVMTENYLLHYGWTFRSRDSHIEAVPRFLFMNAVGFCLNWVVMSIGAAFLWNYLAVQAAAILVVVSWNFLLSSFWIFRRKQDVCLRDAPPG